MKHITKSISIVLALLMLTSVFAVAPITANAEEAKKISTGNDSGITGDCEWSFDSSIGELTISGNGAMDSYGGYTAVPWYDFKSDIKKVSVLNGVTEIGHSAFEGCENLNEISIAESVTRIYSSAFLETAYSENEENWINSSQYGALYIDNYLIDIKKYPIDMDEDIPVSFSVRAGTTIIADGALDYKNIPNTFEIPESVINIGESAFVGCDDIENINVSPQNTVYSSEDGNLYNKTKSRLIKYCPLKPNTEFTVPDSVEAIEEEAFADCDNLKKVDLPDGLTKIGDRAFFSCDELEEIKLPDGLTKIGDQAFYYCDELEEIKLPDSLRSIGSMAFESCVKLKELTLPQGLIGIADRAFFNCPEIKRVNVPESVIGIGKEALGYSTDTENWENPSTIKVKDFTVCGYSGTIAEIYAESNSFRFESTGQGKRSSDFTYMPVDENTIEITGYIGNDTDIIIPNEIDGFKVVSMESGTFENNEKIRSVVLPDSITEISYKLFSGCTNLKSVVIPENVTKICAQAFYECKNLESAPLPDKLKEIDNFAFYHCEKLKAVDLPKNLKKLDFSAFDSCFSIKSVVIPASLREIGGQAFVFCFSLSSLVIEEGVKVIGGYAFQGCDNLKTVLIPEGVTKVEWYAFSVTAIENLSIPSTVTSIGEAAFRLAENAHVYYNGSEEEWKNIEINSASLKELSKDDISFEQTFPQEIIDKITETVPTDSTTPSESATTQPTETTAETEPPTVTEPNNTTLPTTPTTTPVPKLKKSSVSLKAGQISTITVQNKGNNKVTYKSSNSKVAAVKNGKVTALKKGKANITVTVGKTKLTYKVSVTTSPKLSKKSVSVKKGKTVTVKIKGKASGVNNKYTNTKYAKIKSKRSATKLKIKGLKKGKTTLKIKVNGVALKLKVKVK